MKFFRKYSLPENRLLRLYTKLLMPVMTTLVSLASVVFILSVIYEHGFVISLSEEKALETVSRWVWAIFLLDVTLHLLLKRRFKGEGYRRFTRLLSILLYLSLLPVVFTQRPVDMGPVLWVWDILHSEYYRMALLLIFALLHLSNGLMRLLGRRANPSLILAVSFLVIILCGTGLLMLPRCTVSGISWVDSLFIATSAVCVTGLTPVDVASTFTPMGFGVILFLIQVGGLGIMTLTSFFAMFFMGNTSLYNQMLIRDMISSNSLSSLLSTLFYILVFTLVIESIGLLAIWWSVHGTLNMTLEDELAFSAFHAVSAFCNAGFSTLPGNLGNPLLVRNHNLLYVLISFLIILGGIGYPILVNCKDIAVRRVKSAWRCLRTRERERRSMYHSFSLNTRIVLRTTLLLLILGTVVIALFEWNHAFREMPAAGKLTQAFFNAVSPRTAGFNSVSLTTFSVQSILFYMLLMWIGGASQSTAGGIKVNAFAVIMLNLIAIIRGTHRVEVMGRELSLDSIRRANATMVMSLGTLFVFIFILTILEPGLPVLTIAFECVSAIGTVGSSLNATPLLGSASKILVAVLMFFGRVGLITFALGVVKQKKSTRYRYPSDDIIIN